MSWPAARLSWPAANFPAASRRTAKPRSAAARSAPARKLPLCSYVSALSVRRVGRFIGCNHGFVALANGQQLVLAHDVLAAMLHVVLVDTGEHDRIHRTRFLAEAAVNAFEQIDVIAARPPRAVR